MNDQIYNYFAKECLEALLIDFGTVKKSQKFIGEDLEVSLFFQPYSSLKTPENLDSYGDNVETDSSPETAEQGYLGSLLSQYGKVTRNLKLEAEAVEVDIFFEPFSKKSTSSLSLGILGKMVKKVSLFEVYGSGVTNNDFRASWYKLYVASGNYPETKDENSLNGVYLWMLTPSCLEEILKTAGAKPLASKKWEEGIYFLPPAMGGAVIVTDRLPKIPETLWLRLLGRGEVQKQAVEELIKLPDNNPHRNNVLKVLAKWYKCLDLIDNMTSSEQEDKMNLYPAYLHQEEDAKG